MSAAFLSLYGVRVERGKRAVLEVPRLELEAGELHLLCGENGSGKTTFILAAAGLIDLQDGSMKLFDKNSWEGHAPAPRDWRSRLALVHQTPYLFSHSALWNVTYGLRLRGMERAERRRRAESALVELGIVHLKQRRADELSVGEQKLCSLARALVLEPQALLLDEVTASLDDAARGRVREAIERRVKESGTSVLFATHLAETGLSGRRLELRAGRILEPAG